MKRTTQYLSYPSVPITCRGNKPPRSPKSSLLEEQGLERGAGRALCLPLGTEPALNEVTRRPSAAFGAAPS